MQEAQIHMPAGTVRTSAEPDSLLVVMPAEFDVAGDAGGIGRLALQSDSSSTKVLMDIKGTCTCMSAQLLEQSSEEHRTVNS